MSAIQLDDLMSAEDAMNNMQFSEGNDDIAADNDAERMWMRFPNRCPLSGARKICGNRAGRQSRSWT